MLLYFISHQNREKAINKISATGLSFSLIADGYKNPGGRQVETKYSSCIISPLSQVVIS